MSPFAVSSFASSSLTAFAYVSADSAQPAQNVVAAVTAASCVRAASTRTSRTGSLVSGEDVFAAGFFATGFGGNGLRPFRATAGNSRPS